MPLSVAAAAREMMMEEKTLPWWRKALSYALGGIRSGFGLFSHGAKNKSTLEEPASIAGHDKNPEEEIDLIEHSPELETVVEEVEVAETAPLPENGARQEPDLELPAEESEEAEPAVLDTQPTLQAEPDAEPAVESNELQERAAMTAREVTTEEDAASREVADSNRAVKEPRNEAAMAAEVMESKDVEAAARAATLADKVSQDASEEHGTQQEESQVEVDASAAPDAGGEPAAKPQNEMNSQMTETVGPIVKGGVQHEAAVEGEALAEPDAPHEGISIEPQRSATEAESLEAEEVPVSDLTGPSVQLTEAVTEEARDAGRPEMVEEESLVAEVGVKGNGITGREVAEVHGPEGEPATDIAGQEAEPEPGNEAEVDQQFQSATEHIAEAAAFEMEQNESIPEQNAQAAEAAAMSEAVPAEAHAAGNAPAVAATSETVEATDEALQEPAPAPAAAAKPFIKLESRDNEADLSPFSVVVSQVYDGPLDLLLDLIRKQDIDIYDIPIARITAQFLAYVNQLKASDVDVAGEFIYTASLLIHIKSKMLLPRAPTGPDDAAEDPRRELVERLLEHERFKNAAQMLQQKQMLEAASWSNPGIREFQEDAGAEPEIAADTVDLVRIFRDILERARNRPVINVQEDSVTVGQMIQFLSRRLTMEDKPVALRRLLSHTRSERALIAMFLALLELVRLQAILLRQDRAFSEIFIKKHTGFESVMNEGLANARDDWR